ncbi:MAG: hypothetical protein AAF416_16470 [Pseudomonadota bacterium]
MLFVYRRTAFLPSILERIAAARPPRVFVFADAPREGGEDAEGCRDVLALIEEWRCPAPLEFSVAPRNLGNSGRVTSGVDAVLAEVDRAIFIEDDVALSPGFLPFCDALLEQYAETPEVMMISGLNPLDRWADEGGRGHHFSTLGHAQAWATWRRAWRRRDGALGRWQEMGARSELAAFLGDDEIGAERARLYDALAEGRVTTWDYHWALARQLAGGLCAVPSRNLALHRGNDPGAAHVRRRALLYELAQLHDLSLGGPPPQLKPDRAFDRLIFELGHNRLSSASARRLARPLIEDGRRLLALALLRHAMRGGVPDAETEALMRLALRGGGGATKAAENQE